MRLENVTLTRCNGGYTAMGNVFGSNHFDDGTLIITHEISIIDFDDMTIESAGFVYEFDKIKEINGDELLCLMPKSGS